MPDQKERAMAIFEVEDKIPVGSIDKTRAEMPDRSEQYPIPAPRPVPWEEA
ncbi:MULTISPECIES: hypothetical protein [Brevibacillus]|mgnify:FL=1|jgi:hypothetical protein|uniref:hypothetical protein n=1 Tax=Brevibacillus TaxID=55080 RepID=UPI001E35F6DD|nr:MULTISPECIES: hypothetical protein [Bacillales]MDT3416886.1 hypothetical protein [Brevibacillus aydinogluensis]UFJ62245.1 hypothetical protein IRT44_05390 [Anoxybacillus sediminis]